MSIQDEGRRNGGLGGAWARVETQVRDLMERVRNLAWKMRPSILDDYGLEQALARFAEETTARAGIRTDFQALGPGEGPRLQ